MFDEIRELERRLKIPKETFAKEYFKRMENFPCWRNGKKPICNHCQNPIESPRDLRRYSGLDLHPNCFREIYSEGNWRSQEKTGYENRLNELRKRHWERILVLDLEILEE